MLELSKKLPKLKKSKILFEHDEFKVLEDHMLLPSLVSYRYISFLSSLKAVMVLPITEEGLYVLNLEYRHPTKKILWSLPGGAVDEGEETKEAAQREFMEETGYGAEEFIPLGSGFPFPGRSPQQTFYFLATSAKRITDPVLEDCEIIKTNPIAPEELEEKILAGEDVDSHLLTVLYLKTLYDKTHK